jgi:hypothetical protein
MIAIISKLWDIAWDMWQHRNHIAHNTLHPKKIVELARIGQQVEELYAQGAKDLLQRNQSLFQKSLATIKKGNCNEQEQWVTSVLLAKQRSAAVKSACNTSMTTERTLMETWPGMLPDTEEVRSPRDKNDKRGHICRAAAGGGYVKHYGAGYIKEILPFVEVQVNHSAPSGFKVCHRQFSCNSAKLTIENYITLRLPTNQYFSLRVYII